MGTFRITIEIGDQSGQRFREVEALVDTGATFTKVPRAVLESLEVPADQSAAISFGLSAWEDQYPH